MKVLLINTATKGGAANACIRLHLGLLKLGLDSKLLYFHDSTNVPQAEAFFDFHKENYLDAISSASNWSKLVRKFRMIFKKDQRWKDQQHRDKQRKVEETRIKRFEVFSYGITPYRLHEHPWVQDADVINLHWVNNFLDYGSFFKSVKKPIVWTLHEMYAFTGGCSYTYDCKQFESACTSCPQLADEHAGYVANLFQAKEAIDIHKNIRIAAPSQWLLDLSKSSRLFGNRTHQRIPYGIDTGVFKYMDMIEARSSLGWNQKTYSVLFIADSVGNVRKGFSFVLEAIELLKKETENVTFVAVGKEPKEIPENVKTTGSIADPTLMAAHYAAADVFIIPTLADNLPNTVIESLVCGTPVIGFPNGGVPEMVEHEQNGLLCEASTGESLAASILAAKNNYDFNREQIALDSAESYNLAKQAKAYKQVYLQALEKE